MKIVHGVDEIRVNMGLFDFDVITILGTYEEALEYVKWKFEIPASEDFDDNQGFEPRGKFFYKAGYVPVIWIPAKPKTPREIATLAHEALHAVYHLHDWASVPTNGYTEEMTAHAQAHIVTSVLTELNKKKPLGITTAEAARNLSKAFKKNGSNRS